MSWDTEMVEILRVMVNDMAGSAYTSLSLKRVLAVAALQLSRELTFSREFRGVPDENAPDITPDPTEGGARDESFINLCCLKAACIADQGAAVLAAKQAIAVKDGSSAIDLRGILAGKLKLLEKGWCAAYQEAKAEYFLNQSGLYTTQPVAAGAAIMTPFRLAAGWEGGHRDRDFYA